MKSSELQPKSRDELQVMLDELRVRLGKFRFELANKNLKDSSQIGKTKKDIARIMT
ncbi:MAG: 50S ribosomal protein L29, partial [Candidatus Yanofskybacteria bacterium]|nr:50S ribosomal protein L29 [Candidatus Yanofskybacteria bacterium]